MRMRQPRIPPLDAADWSAEQVEAMAPMGERARELNIFRTLARHPAAARALLEWGGYVLGRHNTLPPRERELVILRTGFRCRSGYEWTQHVAIGRDVGLAAEEVERIKRGPDAPGWSGADAALLRTVDELLADYAVGDATWQALAGFFTERQCMDVVFTIGQYTQVSMLLNAFGVQLEDGGRPEPDLDSG